MSSSGFLFKGRTLVVRVAGLDKEFRECKVATPVGVDLAEVDASL